MRVGEVRCKFDCEFANRLQSYAGTGIVRHVCDRYAGTECSRTMT